METSRRRSVAPERSTVRVLRALVLGLLVFGCLGTAAELLLLEHHEKLWQRLPLLLLFAAVLIAIGRTLWRGRVGMRVLQATMIVFVASGLLGLWQHYQVDVEFEREMYPSLEGLQLFTKAIQGATPTLAPGTMIQLGLLGLLYTFRHPVFTDGRAIDDGDE